MRYIDSHSHLNFSQYEKDRAEAILRMREAGVGTITVGTDVQTSNEAIELAAKHENVWASVGVHPTEKDSVDFEELERLVGRPKVVAVGECGLDYFHKPYDEEAQKELFLKHLALAQKNAIPLIIHCRGAYDELLAILREQGVVSLQGVMHFFAGTKEQAQAFLDLGMYVSFAGPVTFTEEYDRVITAVPLEKILIETDSPFAAPAPYRGKRNEPAYVVEVAKKVAAVKRISVEDIAVQTTQNAKDLFKI